MHRTRIVSRVYEQIDAGAGVAFERKPERHTEGQLPADRAGHDVVERLPV